MTMPSGSELSRSRLIEDNEIPPLPEGWDVRRFRFLFRESKERNGSTPVGEMLSVSEYRGVVPREYEHEEQQRADEDLQTYRVVRPGQLAVNTMWLNHLGLGVSDHLGHVSPAYAVYDISPKLDTRFVHHLFRSKYYLKIYLRYLYGIRPNSFQIKADDWNSVPVIVPPRDAQKAIAIFLDRETTRIDQLIEKKQRLMGLLGEKLDRTVRAFISGEVEYPSDEQRCETGIGYLPTVPKHWSVEKIGWRYEIQLGKMLDSAKQTGEHMRRYLRVADVQWGKINTIDLPMMDFCPSDRKRFRLLPGDLLVNEGGSYVGRSAVWRSTEREVYYQKALHRVRPRQPKRDIADFLYYLMWFATKYGVFVAGGNQTTIDHLTAEAFSRYRFAFPTVDEQLQISERLRSEEAKHDEVSTKVISSIDCLREFRAALITAAVTGQIDVATWGKQGQTDRRLDEIEEAMRT